MDNFDAESFALYGPAFSDAEHIDVNFDEWFNETAGLFLEQDSKAGPSESLNPSLNDHTTTDISPKAYPFMTNKSESPKEATQPPCVDDIDWSLFLNEDQISSDFDFDDLVLPDEFVPHVEETTFEPPNKEHIAPVELTFNPFHTLPNPISPYVLPPPSPVTYIPPNPNVVDATAGDGTATVQESNSSNRAAPVDLDFDADFTAFDAWIDSGMAELNKNETGQQQNVPNVAPATTNKFSSEFVSLTEPLLAPLIIPQTIQPSAIMPPTYADTAAAEEAEAAGRPDSSSSPSTSDSSSREASPDDYKPQQVFPAFPSKDPSLPHVQIGSSSKATLRSGKIQSFEPKKVYKDRKAPYTTWKVTRKSFKYLENGELAEATYSASRINDFLVHHPSNQEAGKNNLTLWLQRTPADSARRYSNANSSKCRFACCPARNRTILPGHYRVVFDEKHSFYKSFAHLDPFVFAGAVHLYCLERFLDFPLLCTLPHIDVAPDTRAMPAEMDGRNRMELGGPDGAAATKFIKQVRKDLRKFYEKHPEYPSRDRTGTDWTVQEKQHEGTLNFAMQSLVNHKRGVAGTNFKKHMGDVELCDKMQLEAHEEGRTRRRQAFADKIKAIGQQNTAAGATSNTKGKKRKAEADAETDEDDETLRKRIRESFCSPQPELERQSLSRTASPSPPAKRGRDEEAEEGELFTVKPSKRMKKARKGYCG